MAGLKTTAERWCLKNKNSHPKENLFTKVNKWPSYPYSKGEKRSIKTFSKSKEGSEPIDPLLSESLLLWCISTVLYKHWICIHRDALLYTHRSQTSPAPIFHWSIGIQPYMSLQHSRWVTEPCQQPCSTSQDNFTVFCLNIVQWIWFLIQNNNGIWHSFNSIAILDGMEGFFSF